MTKYYYASGKRVAMRAGGVLYYLHNDHLGSTSLTTDESGGVMARQLYYPYGEVCWGEGTAATDFGFTGQRSVAGTGLVFMHARFYDPRLGRFVSADTIVPGSENPQAFNRYSYTLGNPIKYTDPSGHWVWIPILAAGGAILTTVTYLATTPAEERNVGDALLVAGAGAVGGALIGTGIGIVGGTVLAGATATAGTATAAAVVSGLTGAGTGAIVSAESYMASNARSGESFNTADFATTTVFGIAEGAASAIPSGPLAPLARIGMSGAFAAAESAVGDLGRGNSVHIGNASKAAGFGIFAGIGGELISGGIMEMAQGSCTRESADWVDLTASAFSPDSTLASMALSQAVPQMTRTTVRDFLYGFGFNYATDWIESKLEELQ